MRIDKSCYGRPIINKKIVSTLYNFNKKNN